MSLYSTQLNSTQLNSTQLNSTQLYSTLLNSTQLYHAGGENISSIEVESILLTHPLIDEAAVIAVPDERWGEVPCAFITLRDGTGSKIPITSK